MAEPHAKGAQAKRASWFVRRLPLAGFTLTELLVVIAIIMALAMLAAGTLAVFRRGQRLDHAVRLMQSVLNDARRRAVTLHARHVIVFYGFEEAEPGHLDLKRVRHALRVYCEPYGDPSWGEGYFPGGYVGQPHVLDPGLRFVQNLGQVKIWDARTAANPAEPLPLDHDYFRKRNREALALRPDGSFEDRNDFPGVHPAVGRNIYQPDERFYRVPADCRADIVIAEMDPSGREELRSGGKFRRGMVDLELATGRAVARVFEVGEGFDTE